MTDHLGLNWFVFEHPCASDSEYGAVKWLDASCTRDVLDQSERAFSSSVQRAAELTSLSDWKTRCSPVSSVSFTMSGFIKAVFLLLCASVCGKMKHNLRRTSVQHHKHV